VTRRCFQSFSDLQLQHHLLESAAESNPRSYTDEPAPPTSLGPMESTQQQELGCNSTQNTSLMGEHGRHLYVMLLHIYF
jgi:hypothetical protein